ncbi:cytochrome c oxidase assembly protein COX20, mitochondrial isoform X2 [Misgurnus anguillicaudatus]
MKFLGILDIQNTPCARESILNGAGGSVVAGLVHFLATSRVKRSFDVGVAGFMLSTLGSWITPLVCRVWRCAQASCGYLSLCCVPSSLSPTVRLSVAGARTCVAISRAQCVVFVFAVCLGVAFAPRRAIDSL